MSFIVCDATMANELGFSFCQPNVNLHLNENESYNALALFFFTILLFI